MQRRVVEKTANIKHNGNDPLTYGMAAEIERRLADSDWPMDRIPVRIKFDIRVSAWSNTRVRLENRGGKAFGDATLFFNVLGLHQRSLEFATLLVPHELAHLDSMVSAESESVVTQRKVKIQPHGREWYDSHLKFSRIEPKLHKDIDAIFDMRPALLAQGHAPMIDANGNVHAVNLEKEGADIDASTGKPMQALTGADLAKNHRHLASQLRWVIAWLEAQQ